MVSVSHPRTPTAKDKGSRPNVLASENPNPVVYFCANFVAAEKGLIPHLWRQNDGVIGYHRTAGNQINQKVGSDLSFRFVHQPRLRACQLLEENENWPTFGSLCLRGKGEFSKI